MSHPVDPVSSGAEGLLVPFSKLSTGGDASGSTVSSPTVPAESGNLGIAAASSEVNSTVPVAVGGGPSPPPGAAGAVSLLADGDIDQLLGGLGDVQGGRQGVCSGNTQIYPCWQILLRKWCALDYDVYLVSPFFGSKYLGEVYTIFQNNLNKLHIYTRVPKLGGAVGQAECDAWDKAAEDLLSTIRLPMPYRYFHAKFLAGVPAVSGNAETHVELMVTSANFEYHHFEKLDNNEENHETVCLSCPTIGVFNDNFLNKIQDVCNDTAPPTKNFNHGSARNAKN